MATHQQTGVFATIGQFHHAVVTQAKPLGKICHRRKSGPGCAGNLQQKLMLLRLQVRLGGSLFTEVQKAPQFITELRKNLKPRRCKR